MSGETRRITVELTQEQYDAVSASLGFYAADLMQDIEWVKDGQGTLQDGVSREEAIRRSEAVIAHIDRAEFRLKAAWQEASS